MFKFEKNKNGGNEILKIDDTCFVSFNSRPDSGLSMFAADELGTPETALVIDRKFFILNGDFREEYIAAAPGGVEACIAVYQRYPDKKSTWTTDSEPGEFLKARIQSMLDKIPGQTW